MEAYKKTVNNKDGCLNITYSVSLKEEITELEVADTLVFLQQDDSKLQELFPKYLDGEDISEDKLLKMANEYREYLLAKEN